MKVKDKLKIDNKNNDTINKSEEAYFLFNEIHKKIPQNFPNS